MIEVKMAPVREQVGISLALCAVPGLDADPGSPGEAYLQRALDGMLVELL